MYTTMGSDVTENSVTYKNLSWCSVQNCDIIYGNPFAWEEKTGYNARVGYQFYFNQGNIPIYAGDRVINALKRRFDYIFKSEGNIPGTPNVLVSEGLGETLSNGCLSRGLYFEICFLSSPVMG